MSVAETDTATAAVELNPLRLYSPAETRQIMLGPDVADSVFPTERWLKRQAGLGLIDCTKVGRATYFSADDIRSLIASCARGLYGRPKNPRKRK